MKLYHLTALASTSKRILAEGAFTAPRQQELVLGTACTLELYRLLPKDSKLRPLFRSNVFANILNLATFRLPATKRDFLLVTSDSGTLTILIADESTNTFKRIHCETLGKTGIRRIVPGHLLASDPRGRACMLAALEKVKICFVLNRDTEENLTISSALEANKSNTVTFAVVAVDVGFENPVFAALEQSYDEGASKQLVYYELDLGLNHVSRKAVSRVRDSTLALIPVPSYQDGPGGVLLISIHHITYCNLLAASGKNEKMECRIPYRHGTDPHNTMVVSSTMYHDRKRRAFFFMMCTENGDLIKADVGWNAVEGATQLRAVYFDSLPAPATNMSILRAGFLIVPMEGDDIALLRFKNVDIEGDDPAGGYSSSTQGKVGSPTCSALGARKGDFPSNLGQHQEQNGTQVFDSKLEFRPRTKLKNLAKVETHPTFTSLLDINSGRDEFGHPCLLAASGRGRCAKFSVLRRGASLVDMSSHVRLPFRAARVFAFGDHLETQHHSFIIVSSFEQTMVLRVHDGTIQESYDSGFEQASATLFAGIMSHGSFVQVHAGGIRFIPYGRVDEATEWKPPGLLSILAGSGNTNQLVVGLSSGTVVYFEVDDESGYLTEVDQAKNVLARTDADDGLSHSKANFTGNALISIQATPPGRLKASYFAAADGVTNRIRLFRIGIAGSIEALGLQIAPARVCSLALVDFGAGAAAAFDESTRLTGGKVSKERRQKDYEPRVGYEPMICLVSGTVNGVVTRAIVDSNTGNLLGKRTMLVGSGPVRTAPFRIHNISVCLLLCSRSVLLRNHGGMLFTLPLLTSPIYDATSFSSQSVANGMVAITGASLRLLSFRSTELFSSSAMRISSLPPSILPTKLELDLNFSMDRVALLGSPRRIIPMTIQPSFQGGDDRSGRTNDGRACQLYVLLQTDHTKAAPRSAEEEKKIDRRNPSKTRHRGETTSFSVPSTWHSAIQVFKLLGRENYEPVLGSWSSTHSTGSAIKLTDSLQLPLSNCVLDGISTTFRAGEPNGEGAIYIIVSITRCPISSQQSSGRDVNDHKSGALLTYTMDPSTSKLSLLHETGLSEPARVIKRFRDMIAVGCGRSLELYSLGKKKLLKKAECRYAVANNIVAVAVAGSDRIFIGDVRESVTTYRYICNRQNDSGEHLSQPNGGRFVVLASDSIPRWITSMVLLDYNSVACGDKFGNVCVLRLSKPRSSGSERAREHNGIAQKVHEPVVDIGSDKLVVEASIHVGSTVTALTLGCFSLQPFRTGDAVEPYDDAILFATIEGSLGILMPLRRQSDIRLLSSVEAMMRSQRFSLCGRDHISFRSAFGPIKNVIDGDLCEMFDSLPWDRKVEFAEQIGRSVREIVYKLEELRSSVM